jgi:tetratricopeptide (TPR) repeat protein
MNNYLKHRPSNQNLLVVWLDTYIDNSSASHREALSEIEEILNTIHVFTNADECVDFLTEIINEKVFMIVSSTLDQGLVSCLQDLSPIYSIYVLQNDNGIYNLDITRSIKVKGLFHSINDICKSLKQDVKQCDDELPPISIISSYECSKHDLNELPPLFMYSQILKEILLNMDHHENAKEELVHFWYESYHDNEPQIRKIGEFERDYHAGLAIHWYTRENFVYSVLNRALRTFDVGIIVMMGFFLRDLHQQIKQRHDEQSKNRIEQTYTVYRGQAMYNDDFKKLCNSPNGLLSFNNFLSTSTDQAVSMMFCPIPLQDPNMTAVLFKIEVDPNLTCTPFVIVKDNTNFGDEQEILFSMHSVFRIGKIDQTNVELIQVELVLTNDNDKELKQLTDCMWKEIQGGTGWHQLGQLLIKIGNFDKAEELYQILIEQTNEQDMNIRPLLYNQIGLVKHRKGEIEDALQFYNKKFEIDEKSSVLNPNIATTYNNIASTYDNRGEYSKALEFYDKTLKIEKCFLASNDPELATTYSNIGATYKHNGKYSKALHYYKMALEICEKSPLPNHPDLVPIYNNVAALYYELERYSEALDLHRKALQIEEKSLPPNHWNFVITYCSIGLMHKKMNDCSQALILYQKALDIAKESLPKKHTYWATLYSNIAMVHCSQKDYSKALKVYYKTLEIEEDPRHPNRAELVTTYTNIGAIFDTKKEYWIALHYYQKALEISKNHLPPHHPVVANLYQNMGVAYYNIKDYQQALSSFERALPIFERSYPANHSRITDCKESIAQIRNKLSGRF